MVDDITRPTPMHRYVLLVLEWLQRHGARLDDMLLVPALGIHRDMNMTEVEMTGKVGAANTAGLKVGEPPSARSRRPAAD